ncbi:MAG: putative 2OG-Fe(II) oxygenase [Kiloniellales bacterium]
MSANNAPERLSLYATPIAASVPAEAQQLATALGPRVQQMWQAAQQQQSPLPWQSQPQFLDQQDGPLNLLTWMTHTIADAMTAPARWPGPQQTGWDVLWFAEVCLPGQGQPIHDYPRADWCACFLIDDGGGQGESGEVELLDPRGAAVLIYAPDLTFDAPGSEVLGISQTVALTSGSLLVFPAWMRQGTSVNQGTRPRLAIKLLLTKRYG